MQAASAAASLVPPSLADEQELRIHAAESFLVTKATMVAFAVAMVLSMTFGFLVHNVFAATIYQIANSCDREVCVDTFRDGGTDLKINPTQLYY